MQPKITVSNQTRLADILAAYPWLPDALIAIDPQFKKINNPLIRALIMRSTVEDAARRVNVPAPELIARLDALVDAREA